MRGNQRTGHVRGDLVTKPIQSITRGVMREFMINKVLPAVRAKWPREDVGRPIFIQQDNAPTHLKLDDPVFCEATKQEGFNIHLICQPPNSPDFNILDLVFSSNSSNSIQEECKNNGSFSSGSPRGNLINLFNVSLFLQQQIFS
jgi:hypothetical protein